MHCAVGIFRCLSVLNSSTSFAAPTLTLVAAEDGKPYGPLRGGTMVLITGTNLGTREGVYIPTVFINDEPCINVTTCAVMNSVARVFTQQADDTNCKLGCFTTNTNGKYVANMDTSTTGLSEFVNVTVVVDGLRVNNDEIWKWMWGKVKIDNFGCEVLIT